MLQRQQSHACTALLMPWRAVSSATWHWQALEREQTAYRALLMLAGAVLAEPEPMLARLERG